MIIKKASYGNMDWVKALEAHRHPADPTRDLEQQNEADLIENALESTAQIAFGLTPNAETKHDALLRASKEIADKTAHDNKYAASNEIRTKLASAGIDPIALGISVREPNGIQRPIQKEEWEGASDARWVEKIATAAALEYERRAKTAWETEAMKPAQNLSSKFNPTVVDDILVNPMMSGKIMSSAGANEETRDRPRNMPANSASIFDPKKLDRFSKAETEHDKSVAKIRADQKSRIAEKKADLQPKDLGPDPMKAGAISRSGGEDRDVFNQRAPKNRLSMTDLQGTENLSAAEMKAKLEALFMRVEDNGTSIRQANSDRKEKIQGKKQADRSWEKVEKSISTAELSKRLMDSFTCPKPDGE